MTLVLHSLWVVFRWIDWSCEYFSFFLNVFAKSLSVLDGWMEAELRPLTRYCNLTCFGFHNCLYFQAINAVCVWLCMCMSGCWLWEGTCHLLLFKAVYSRGRNSCLPHIIWVIIINLLVLMPTRTLLIIAPYCGFNIRFRNHTDSDFLGLRVLVFTTQPLTAQIRACFFTFVSCGADY